MRQTRSAQSAGEHGCRDEDRLVAALRLGDSEAFAHMVTMHGPRMLAVARRYMKVEEDARDCLQDAFLQAYQNIGRFEGRSSLATWLHRIVVNSALMKLRARKRKPEESIEHLLPRFEAGECRVEPHWRFAETVDEMAARKEVRLLVRQEIDRLPDQYRIVLLLRDIEEYSTEETAELLEKSPGAVKVSLHRARAALKKRLEPLFAVEGGE